MYAEVGRNTLDPGNMPSREVIQRLQALLAQQPGYRGYLALEAGEGQRVYLRLWDSPEAAQAALASEAVRDFLAQHVRPLIRGGEMIGQGPVIHCDFSKV